MPPSSGTLVPPECPPRTQSAATYRTIRPFHQPFPRPPTCDSSIELSSFLSPSSLSSLMRATSTSRFVLIPLPPELNPSFLSSSPFRLGLQLRRPHHCRIRYDEPPATVAGPDDLIDRDADTSAGLPRLAECVDCRCRRDDVSRCCPDCHSHGGPPPMTSGGQPFKYRMVVRPPTQPQNPPPPTLKISQILTSLADFGPSMPWVAS